MDTNSKKKSCWNCETDVALSEENCLSCGVYVSTFDDNENGRYNILIPPYKMQAEEEAVTKDLNASYKQNYSEIKDENKVCEKVTKNETNSNGVKFLLVTIMLLSLGLIFLLFASFLFLFSQNGNLVLSWNANYWYLYLIFSCPMLFLGWKALHLIPAD